MALSGHRAADEDDHIVGAAECMRVVFILPAAVAVKHLFFAPRPDTTVTGHVAVVAQFMRRAEEQHDLLSAEHDRLLAAAASPPAPTGVWPDTQWAAQWRRVDEVYREQTTTLNSTTSFGEGELEQAARALMSANNDWSLRLNILGSALYDSPPPGGRWTADLIDKIFKTRRRYELGHDGIPVPALVAAATEAASDAQAARLGSCGPSPLPLNYPIILGQ